VVVQARRGRLKRLLDPAADIADERHALKGGLGPKSSPAIIFGRDVADPATLEM